MYIRCHLCQILWFLHEVHTGSIFTNYFVDYMMGWRVWFSQSRSACALIHSLIFSMHHFTAIRWICTDSYSILGRKTIRPSWPGREGQVTKWLPTSLIRGGDPQGLVRNDEISCVCSQTKLNVPDIDSMLANPCSAETVFIRQNLSFVEVRFWRIKTVPTMKEWQYLYWS